MNRRQMYIAKAESDVLPHIRPQKLWKCCPSQVQRGAWFLINDQIILWEMKK